MITEYDLQEAIAECKGQRNPNANTCLKLAAFYTIKDHMYPESDENRTIDYSFAPAPDEPVEHTIRYSSDTEFAQEIEGKNPDYIWPVIDELMTTLHILNPRLYDGVMQMIREIK